MGEATTLIIEVARTDLASIRTVDPGSAPLGPGEARLRVDAFALTSNNITYAVFGEAMRYWDFFPSTDPTTWGRLPVWGFGEVVETTSADCSVGERLYGFFPMASELVIAPGRSDPSGLSDIAGHRAPMAGTYNRYTRAAADPTYRADRKPHQMLLYPLFFTSFLIDDCFADDAAGSRQIIVSSASSKTSIGVAFQAKRRGGRAVGLTSERNREFVESLGVYDTVLTYDHVDDIERHPSTYVDIAGNADVLHAVHARLDGVLESSMTVGDTHWDHTAIPSADLPGPAPGFFFAPGRIKERTDQWGREELDRRFGEAWHEYREWADGWIELRDATGPDAVSATYAALLAGTPHPRTGFIGSLTRDGTERG